MLIWLYQYEQIMQVVIDDQNVEEWVQCAAEYFPDAIYFYAELVYEPREKDIG